MCVNYDAPTNNQRKSKQRIKLIAAIVLTYVSLTTKTVLLEVLSSDD